MVVVDFPSPSGVGVIPATTTYFPLLQVGQLNFKNRKKLRKSIETLIKFQLIEPKLWLIL